MEKGLKWYLKDIPERKAGEDHVLYIWGSVTNYLFNALVYIKIPIKVIWPATAV